MEKHLFSLLLILLIFFGMLAGCHAQHKRLRYPYQLIKNPHPNIKKRGIYYPSKKITPASYEKIKIVKKYVPVPMREQWMSLNKSDIINKGPLTHYYNSSIPLSTIQRANQQSIQEPNAQAYINSIATFPYMEGALYKVYTAPLKVTDLTFEAGEKIISIAAGDTLRWKVNRTYSGKGNHIQEHIIIKPLVNDINTNMVITSDVRTYHLKVASTEKTYMSALRWTYPQSDNHMIKQFQPLSSVPTSSLHPFLFNRLNFHYQMFLLKGIHSPNWIPEIVFDNGKKTYIKFHRHINRLPTLFTGHADKHFYSNIANYRVIRDGDYYELDGLYPLIQLRMGKGPYESIIQIERH